MYRHDVHYRYIAGQLSDVLQSEHIYPANYQRVISKSSPTDSMTNCDYSNRTFSRLMIRSDSNVCSQLKELMQGHNYKQKYYAIAIGSYVYKLAMQHCSYMFSFIGENSIAIAMQLLKLVSPFVVSLKISESILEVLIVTQLHGQLASYIHVAVYKLQCFYDTKATQGVYRRYIEAGAQAHTTHVH